MKDPTRDPARERTSLSDERSCALREEALALHVGGDLPPGEARELELHLDRCPVCAAFLAELRASQEAFGRLADPPPHDSVKAVHRRVMEAVRTETVKREHVAGRSPAWRWAAAAAVLLLLGAALLGRLALRTGGPEEGSVEVVAVGPNEGPPTATEGPEAPGHPSVAADRPLDREPVNEKPSPGAGPTDEPTPMAPEGPRPAPAPHRLQPPQPEIQRAGLDGSQDLKIQLVSDDPDIVIYWLVDTEDTPDATPTT